MEWVLSWNHQQLCLLFLYTYLYHTVNKNIINCTYNEKYLYKFGISFHANILRFWSSDSLWSLVCELVRCCLVRVTIYNYPVFIRTPKSIRYVYVISWNIQFKYSQRVQWFLAASCLSISYIRTLFRRLYCSAR